MHWGNPHHNLTSREVSIILRVVTALLVSMVVAVSSVVVPLYMCTAELAELTDDVHFMGNLTLLRDDIRAQFLEMGYVVKDLEPNAGSQVRGPSAFASPTGQFVGCSLTPVRWSVCLPLPGPVSSPILGIHVGIVGTPYTSNWTVSRPVS